MKNSVKFPQLSDLVFHFVIIDQFDNTVNKAFMIIHKFDLFIFVMLDFYFVKSVRVQITKKT